VPVDCNDMADGIAASALRSANIWVSFLRIVSPIPISSAQKRP
jgi:hypothetical protein